MSTEIVVARPVQNDTVETAITGMLGNLHSPLSRVMYERAARDFLSYLQVHQDELQGRPPAVAFADYLRSLEESGRAASTIKAKYSQLRQFFKWAAVAGLITDRDLLAIREVSAPKMQGKRAGKWLSVEQIDALLDVPDMSTRVGRRDRALLGLMLRTGLRRSEVCALTWQHFDQIKGVWVIKDLKRKHGRTQDYLPVPDQVIADLRVIERGAVWGPVFVSYSSNGYGQALSPMSIYNIVSGYCERLGYGKVAPHDLRRSFAEWFKDRGASIEQISQMLGHGSILTTQRYLEGSMDLAAIASIMENS